MGSRLRFERKLVSLLLLYTVSFVEGVQWYNFIVLDYFNENTVML